MGEHAIGGPKADATETGWRRFAKNEAHKASSQLPSTVYPDCRIQLFLSQNVGSRDAAESVGLFSRNPSVLEKEHEVAQYCVFSWVRMRWALFAILAFFPLCVQPLPELSRYTPPKSHIHTHPTSQHLCPFKFGQCLPSVVPRQIVQLPVSDYPGGRERGGQATRILFKVTDQLFRTYFVRGSCDRRNKIQETEERLRSCGGLLPPPRKWRRSWRARWRA